MFGTKNPDGVEIAYKTLARQLLEYCYQAWNPHLIRHINSIESIQRRATRLKCGFNQSYSERLKVLNWPTLKLQRKYLCLVQLYKIMFGYCDIDECKYLDIVGQSRVEAITNTN